jgi:dimeric dUTPase (all-alpha-NTP-PPase superfamily)
VTTASNDTAIRYPRQFAQIRQMVEAQASLNSQAYSQTWMAMGALNEDDPKVWDYPLAAAQEIGEFLNSWGYAWWSTKNWPIEKPQDESNCMTELVDAWHFILSQALIEEDGDAYRASTSLLLGFAATSDSGVMDSHRSVVISAKKLMAYLADWVNSPVFTTEIYAQFFQVLTSAGFSLDHFHARYSAKLQLNIFRQLNGYKEKPRTYVKEWQGDKEDNFFLAQWIDAIFIDVKEGHEARMPTDAEIMKWIAANYYLYTNKSAVTPNVVEEDKDE